MTKHKFHQWHRMPTLQSTRKNTFFCRHPLCYRQVKLNALHHKIAECTICNNKFIIDITLVTDEMVSLNCPTCLGITPSGEAATFETVKEGTSLFLEENFDKLRLEIEEEKAKLANERDKLERRENKLAAQRKAHLGLMTRHRIEFARKRNTLLKLKQQLDEKAKQLKVQSAEIDQEVIADALLTLFKQGQDQQNESNGSSDT